MSRVWTPDCYRDGAVYAAVVALDAAQAIGDPDDLERIATAVVDALAADTDDPPNYEGWLLVRGEPRRVIEIDHADANDGCAVYVVVVEASQNDDR